ncbi:MAG TPA: xanthine dehydrogenase family protein subunit M [Myxococcaceae bacterium]|nr:xanthine dehydrogenase family protein subunit M [Myxococcaceae bacterium]
MYPAPFEYHAPATLPEAIALIGRFGDDAKLLAGSQSLIPLMKLRLATPAHLIDLRKIAGLRGISAADGALRIGAMTTHREIESSEQVRARLPVMSEAAARIGDPQVRNLGTIGGSLSHADPSADWPAVMVALDATVQIASAAGERTLKVEDLIQGPLTTALEPSEILIEVRVPELPARAGAAYEKLPHPASRFAVVGAAAWVALDAARNVAAARVALTGLGPKVTRATSVERALIGTGPDPSAVDAASARAAEGLELRPDLIGSAEYKAHLAAVYTARAVRRAIGRARER